MRLEGGCYCGAVRYVVEGSVRRAGSHIRLTAQLIDGTSGLHLWSETLDGTLAEVAEGRAGDLFADRWTSGLLTYAALGAVMAMVLNAASNAASVILFAFVYWHTSGKKHFHSPAEDMQAEAAALAAEIGEPPKFPEAP